MSPELFGCLLRDIVMPLLVELEQEGHHVRPVLVASIAAGARTTVALVDASQGHRESEPVGEIRIAGRPLFSPGRVRFVVESIFEHQQRGGFTGFEINGYASDTGADIQVRSRVMRYNVLHWLNKLVILEPH
jgi:hypothetical protein